jgi:(p)ppGpp synthase/HD superfamily hydrolase
MRRDTLELADGSLFFERVRRTFTAADAGFIIRADAFLLEQACADVTTAHQAATLLIEQDADPITVAAALLTPLLWQECIDPSEIRKRFGPTVAACIEDLGSPFIPITDDRQLRQRDIHVILSSIGSVPRKALLFITYRLLALQKAIGTTSSRSRKMAQDTLDLLVPIADRLGLGDLRRRLEDTCFRLLDPAGYERLKENVAPIQAEDDRCLGILLAGVRRLLDNNGIQGRVQGRTKSLHGIRRKMARTGNPLQAIMDRIGLRVIVASVPECYTILGLLHAHFKPIPGTFDDYIGLPKDNGYQSLHTCVYPVREVSHKPIEFQVRTELMHMEAEHGTAAHWRYKNGTAAEACDHYKARWMQGLVRQHATADSPDTFIRLLHQQVFHGHVVVFGSGGRIVRLDENATVRDYLNIVNVRISEDALVKVNGRTAALNLTLRDGDSIEVLAHSDSPTSGIEACTNRVDDFNATGTQQLFNKEASNGKKLLRYSRGDIGGNTR